MRGNHEHSPECTDYRFGGLIVRSELEFSHAVPLAPDHIQKVDVEIRTCSLDEFPSNPNLYNQEDVHASEDFVFRVADDLAFRIQNGNAITIYCTPLTSQSDINLYLIGSAWGVLCHQRNLLPLHCSAVTTGHSAVAFCGPAGMGKSTLAAGLFQHGYTHVCDDVATLEIVNGHIQLTPVQKGLKLWRDATETLQLPRGPRVGTHPDLDKYYVDLPNGDAKPVYTLNTIYILSLSSTNKTTITPVTGMEKFRIFLENVYRYEWATQIRDPEDLILQIFQLLDRIEIFEFNRPKNMMYFVEGLAILRGHIESRGNQDAGV